MSLPDISIRYCFKEARKRLKQDGIPILNLMDEDNIEKLLRALWDQEKVFNEMVYQYHKHHALTEEDVLERMEDKDIDEFSDKMWEAIIAFSQPQIRPFIRKLKEQMEEGLRKLSSSPLPTSSTSEQE